MKFRAPPWAICLRTELMPILKDSDVKSFWYHMLLFFIFLCSYFFLMYNGMGGIDTWLIDHQSTSIAKHKVITVAIWAQSMYHKIQIEGYLFLHILKCMCEERCLSFLCFHQGYNNKHLGSFIGLGLTLRIPWLAKEMWNVGLHYLEMLQNSFPAEVIAYWEYETDYFLASQSMLLPSAKLLGQVMYDE